MFFRVSLLVCHKTVCTLVQTHPCVIQSDFVIPYHAGGRSLYGGGGCRRDKDTPLCSLASWHWDCSKRGGNSGPAALNPLLAPALNPAHHQGTAPLGLGTPVNLRSPRMHQNTGSCERGRRARSWPKHLLFLPPPLSHIFPSSP